jgi:molecular chaperone DnaJ
MEKDFYTTLGVPETADTAQIKKAFRALAKKYHPDRNPGNKAAEARFKELSEAYETLSDDKKRSEYDMMRKYGAFSGGPTGGFTRSPFGAAGTEGFDFSDLMSGGRRGSGRTRSFRFSSSGEMGGLDELLNEMFGGGFSDASFAGVHAGPQNPRVAQRGEDINLMLTITLLESVSGVTRVIRGRSTGRKLSVKIPAGIEDGGKIRLAGQGQPGMFGGEQGDLIITVRIMPDQQFERKGNDIYSFVEISFVEAIKGCKKNVKTLTRTVALTIPPGTQPGTTMRLKGMGLAVGSETGDLYVEVKVAIPKTLTEKQKKMLEEWEG